MTFLKLLDKLFDLTSHVESTVELVAKKSRKTIENIISSMIKSFINTLILTISFLLVIAGLIIFLSRYAPLEYVLLFFGLLGFLVVTVQKISIKIK